MDLGVLCLDSGGLHGFAWLCYVLFLGLKADMHTFISVIDSVHVLGKHMFSIVFNCFHRMIHSNLLDRKFLP